ncbi:helix-turn-helix domain-containing protein [Streptomyces sp. NPDC001890]|uniref:helix-turn-helix domain-containing protein n=1 Tax=Streptomyces sp. NPDC001890 TaxID=3364620 RepID=UPI003697A0EB
MRTEVMGSIDTAQFAVDLHARRLSELIKGRRENLGLNQEDVAARLEITSRAYGNWERGIVKEWTDHKLYALADALEMTDFQTARVFWLAVGRAPQPELRPLAREATRQKSATAAFLSDYSIMMDAFSLPTCLIDHGWNVKRANRAYLDLFRSVRPHPTAFPSRNFLRFGLFHPDAAMVFAGHRDWQLSMLAQLAFSLEMHDHPSLQAIRREVCRDPQLEHAYHHDMPDWLLGPGADLVHDEGTVREVRHPDPHVGLQGCRLVEETPRSLQTVGLTRITLVLTAPGRDRPTPEHPQVHNQAWAGAALTCSPEPSARTARYSGRNAWPREVPKIAS